jgi:hypothetical protein
LQYVEQVGHVCAGGGNFCAAHVDASGVFEAVGKEGGLDLL